ncbi:MAG: ABC transporter transmembrane domain-containing protein, partial [Cytophagaceae bacterium]
MNLKSIQNIHEFFLKFHDMDCNPFEISKKTNLPRGKREGIDIFSYLNYLTETGGNIDLGYITNELTLPKLENMIRENHFPILLFGTYNNEWLPIVIVRDKENNIHRYILKDDGEIEESLITNLNDLYSQIYTLEKKPGLTETIVVTGFKNESSYTHNDKFSENKPEEEKPTPVKRLFKVLLSEKKSIVYLYIYAIIAGIISLSLPLGIQSIIGFVTSGQVSTSIVVLISFVTLGVFINGSLQIMQLSLTEHIQQRLFLKTAFDFSYRLPKLKLEPLLKHNPPELINRFFDIVTVQKGVAKILIDFSTAALQIIFGLILLALYHPSFIILGVFLLIILFFLIRSVAPKAQKTSIYESKYKYQVENWLEEIARNLKTFKLAGYSNLPMEKTDYNVSNYLYAREHHFKSLI